MLIKIKFSPLINLLILTLLLILVSSTLHPQSGRKLTIKGLKIFSEEELYSQLKLEKFEEGKIPLGQVISLIEKFYKEKNYTLVKVYKADPEAAGVYALFVDEGRIGKIIVHNLNNYYSLKFKQQIDIPQRIFNTEILNRNLKNLQKKFPSSDIRFELMLPPDYEGNLIQLDREFQKLEFGDTISITLFERYNPLYDLHFYITSGKKNGDLTGKDEGFGFDIDYRYPSLYIPEIYYYGDNIISKKDYLECSLSTGVDPGLKGLFRVPPSNTLLFPPDIVFTELTGEYKISPMKNRFIGPLLRGIVYHSDASRTDLGISGYDYLKLKVTLAPEVTILKNLNFYSGLGMEQFTIYGSDVESTGKKYYSSTDGFYRSFFGESRLKFDPIPIRIGNRIDKYIVLTYTDYFAGDSSNRLEFRGAYDTEFSNLSILSLRIKGLMLFRDPQFYLSEKVNNQYFKGFSGESYYTNKKLSLSGEYRFSIYQDFFYAGAFLDWVLFEPEGYILSGLKQGVVCGPTGRVLIYDQFEFIIYFGFDRLFPDNTTGTDIQMRLRKKW